MNRILIAATDALADEEDSDDAVGSFDVVAR